MTAPSFQAKPFRGLSASVNRLAIPSASRRATKTSRGMLGTRRRMPLIRLGLIVFDKSKHPVTRKNIDERKGKELPNLGDEYEVILPVDRRFDCYSHAMRVYNKIGNAEELEKRLKEQGYELSPTLETDIPGHKVVIYGKKAPDGTITITHASVEYNDGSYQSKLGGGPLIRHKNAQQMCGPIYGEVTRIYIWKKKGG